MTDNQIIISISTFGIFAVAAGAILVLHPTHKGPSLPTSASFPPMNITRGAKAPDEVLQASQSKADVLPATAEAAALASSPKEAPAKGFRGVDWGEMLARRKDFTAAPEYLQSSTQEVLLEAGFVTIENAHIKRYARTGDKLRFGTQDVSGILYATFDGRFYEVEIEMRPDDAYPLSEIFSEMYGPAKQLESESLTSWRWQAGNRAIEATIIYSRPDSGFPNGSSHASITNITLSAELDALQKAEASAELKKLKKILKKDF